MSAKMREELVTIVQTGAVSQALERIVPDTELRAIPTEQVTKMTH
jgi:hypothetical protein